MGRLFVAGLLLAVSLRAAGDPLVERGFDHFYNLEYDEAIADFSKAVERNPRAPELHNDVANAVVFREMLRGGALESELVTGNNPFLRRPRLDAGPEAEKLFLAEIGASLSLCRERLAKDPGDKDALYAMGIAHGLRANWNFLVRKAWRDSLRDATEARKLHGRLSAIDPSNVDARLTQGLHEYVVGSLPLAERLLGFLIGFRGNKERGIRTVQLVAREGHNDRVDAEFFLCALYRREEQPRLALPLIEDLLRRFPRNYLLVLEQAHMYSAIGEKENALAALRKLENLKTRRAPGYARVASELIWYHRGNIEFWYNDLPAALEDMRRVTEARGDPDLNTGVLAWMRRGQICDLMGMRSEALESYKRAIAFAPQSDAARESQRYLSAPFSRGR